MRQLFILTLVIALGVATPGALAGDDDGIPDDVTNTPNTGGNFFDHAVQINGDLCVGNFCTDGETVPLGTIRVDSDNAWLDFVDASTIAGFPSNDWQVQINDSFNGGANFFAIDDVSAATRPFHIQAGAASNSLAVASSDDIGVGTATPASAIDINRAGSIQVTFTNTTPNKVDWKFTNNTNTENFRITVDGSGKQEFDLTKTGDLSLTGSLTVCSAGAASTSGTCAGAVANLPDYVFAPGYRPMSLAALETYVQTNRHLPGVLSAADAAEHGIDLTALQLGVLANVEELVLHTIDQQRALDSTATELESLRAVNAELEARLDALETRLDALDR